MARLGPIILTLEIDNRDEPVSGRLNGSSLPAITFTGWIGLAAAIEQALGVNAEVGGRSLMTEPAERREPPNSRGV